MDFLRRQNPWVLAFACALFLVGGYQILFGAPQNFPSGSTVGIMPGASASSVAIQLAEAHVISHPSLFVFALRISGASSHLQAGAYRFEKPQNVFVVAYRVATGAYDIPPVRLTIIEGTTVREAGIQIAAALPEVTAADFQKVAKPYEGSLFPDTYLLSPSSDASSVVDAMRANFNTKMDPLSADIKASGHSLSDVIILASLVEKEARSIENKHIVAGILLNRLKLGMPLQVDAVFGYIFDRDTYSPSFSDLTVDSPYNTYTHRGLPPGPIDNPGLDSIQAVLHPTKTSYLYYLTGKDTLMHYATTYEQHQANQTKYLH